MPAKYDMTWEPKQRLWRKRYKGTYYTFSCRQLAKWAGENVPQTKEGSYLTANAWWAEKVGQIDGQSNAFIYPYHAHLIRRRDWARLHGRLREVKLLSHEIARMEAGLEPLVYDVDADSFGVDDWDVFNELEKEFSSEEICKTLDGFSEAWDDRLSLEEVPSVPVERTIGGVVKRYIELELIRVNAREISASEFSLTRLCLNAFRDWAGSENLVESINAQRLEQWWEHLLKSNSSVDYKKKKLCHVRNLIQWLGESDLIPIPSNLRRRKHCFRGSPTAVPTLTISEVRRLVDGASGQLRLHLLLMINTGMQQTDISDLKQSEVDWERGRITRKRSKTESEASVPTVTYQLWPQTWELLKEYRSSDSERVLLTKSRGPWVVDKLVGDKRKKVDNIQSTFRHLQIKLKFNRPLKLLRKTSATIIESHENFGRYKSHFLGHSPRTVADRHYSAPSVELFDRIVTWLGEQYGFLPLPDDRIVS